MEEAGPNSPPPEAAISYVFARNFPEPIDQLSPEIPIQEELVEEVMQELYKEITPTTTTTTTTATTTTTDCTKPLSPTASFPTPSWVVGSGKSESCGVSVSDSATTVMAGVKFAETAGKMRRLSPENGVGAWRTECGGGNNNGLVVGKEEVGMDGCDHAGELDDEWFERVLISSWGPVDLDPWFCADDQ